MTKCELWTIKVQNENDECTKITWQGFKITKSEENLLLQNNCIELHAKEIKSQSNRLFKANIEPREPNGNLKTSPLNGKYKVDLFIPESQLSEPVYSDILLLVDFCDCSVWRIESFFIDIPEEMIVAYKGLVMNGKTSYYWMLCHLKNGQNIQIAGEIFKNECGVLKK